MTAHIELDLQRLRGPLIGNYNIELLVDGEAVCSASLGKKVAVEVDPGKHEVQALFHGIITRRSKVINVAVSPDSTTRVTGGYSRLWGNVQLHDENA